MTESAETVVKMRRKTLTQQEPMPLLFSIDVNPNDSITWNLPSSLSIEPEEPQPVVATVPVDPPPVVSTMSKPNRTLEEMYIQLIEPKDKEKRIRTTTIRSNLSSLRIFEAWAATNPAYSGLSGVQLLEAPNVLYQFAQFMRARQHGSSSSICLKAIAAIIKLSGVLVKSDLMRRKPAAPSRSEINVLKPRSERQRRVKAVPVTISELQAMLAVLDGCKWPRLGNVSPAVFWETSLLSHYVYGFRSQDWFAARSNEKSGLLWSGVITSSQCPILDDLENAPGWVWYLVHKTASKDEAAERPADVLVPLSCKMRSLLEQFRGIDPVRVFPLPSNSTTYSREFRLLLERAGLSDEVRQNEGKPIIRLSLGQRNVASFRKSASALWAKQVSRSASSYMLHHAVAEEGVAKMTVDSYLQNEEILRDITANIESLPVWK